MPHGDLVGVEAPRNERLVILTGEVTLGASGAISSQDCVGFSVVQTASETGRYTVTTTHKFLKLKFGCAVLEISADAAPVSAKGTVGLFRNVAPTSKTMDIQFAVPPAAAAVGVDAVPQDSAKIRIMLVLSRGKI